MHRGSILLSTDIPETAQQGIPATADKGILLESQNRDLRFWQPPKGVTANIQSQLFIYQLLLWDSLNHHVLFS